jgi:HPt (histidine-containing phosphotransfer) domain-containing protein
VNTGDLQKRKQARLEKIFRLQTEFLETALVDTKEILALMDGANGRMAADDAERLRKLAHDLRGTGAAYGFSSLSETAGRLEDACDASDPGREVRRCIDDLVEAVGEARTSLKVHPTA